MKHFAILIDNQSKTDRLIQGLLSNQYSSELSTLNGKKGAILSISEVARYLDEEERHHVKVLTKNHSQSLKSMSSGERKKALLNHILVGSPDYLFLVNPYDNLDMRSQNDLKTRLERISKNTILIQLVSRIEDILPFTTDYFTFEQSNLVHYENKNALLEINTKHSGHFDATIPSPLQKIEIEYEELVVFNNISVSFNGKPVLKNIDWTIKKGSFWQLIGPNGSGKSTLLNMITGDSHKGYGQNLILFGNRKGSGESIWDIKKYIGYFTPSMTDKFKGYHTLENMLISGLHDSVGLYIKPTDIERKIALKWLELLGFNNKKDFYFHELSTGEKRLLMVTRAMIKHPPLLILDEPTADLDDRNASFFIRLINKIANETSSAILYVSHRTENGLKPQFTYQLSMNENGSIGKID